MLQFLKLTGWLDFISQGGEGQVLAKNLMELGKGLFSLLALRILTNSTLICIPYTLTGEQ